MILFCLSIQQQSEHVNSDNSKMPMPFSQTSPFMYIFISRLFNKMARNVNQHIFVLCVLLPCTVFTLLFRKFHSHCGLQTLMHAIIN